MRVAIKGAYRDKFPSTGYKLQQDRNKEQRSIVFEGVQVCSESDTSVAGFFKVVVLFFISLSSLFVVESPSLEMFKKACEWGTCRRGLNMVALG